MTQETPSPVEPDVLDMRQIAEGLEIDLFLPDSLFYFRGHFPDHPVLPGVAQIDWAVLFADRHLGTRIGGARRFQVKFRSVIRPGGPITLRLVRAGSDRLQFEFRQAGQVRSSGSIALGEGT